MRIRTTTDAASASASAQDVNLATGSWEETTVTYDTRPTASTSLGQLPGGSTADTAYEITLDEAVIEPLLGTAVTLQVSAAGTVDGFGFWSKEFAASAYRPVLELDFTAPAALSEPTPPTGITAPISIATGSGAGVSSAAFAAGYFTLTSTNSGTSMGGDAWAVDDSSSAGWTISVKVA